MISEAIETIAQLFLQKIPSQKIHLVGHFDTDGITALAIFSKTLQRLNKQFSLKILKQLGKEEIEALPKDKFIVMLDLGSSNIDLLSKFENILIIDHHEISNRIFPNEMNIINPHLFPEEYEELCSAELTYLFVKAVSKENKDLADLAVIGMIGDVMDKEINKLRNIIINDAEAKIKKGILIYPSTRPLDRALEFSSRPFIPGVTGDSKGTQDLLKEAGFERVGKTYKALIDLTEEEMKRLVTAILLRTNSKKDRDYLGNLYLIKFFNKIEDAREISAVINACSRMDNSEVALMFCMGNSESRKKAERIYVQYRQNIIQGLKHIEHNSKIEGKEYVIINAKDKIKDTIIGTLASILSFSPIYKEGTIIVAMAYNQDKIKISARISGKNPNQGRNLKELIESVIRVTGGECGGHKEAAGGTIQKENEEKFIELIQKRLEFEIIKVV